MALVEIDGQTWYYEERNHIDIYHEVQGSVVNIRIPLSKLRKTLRKMGKLGRTKSDKFIEEK